MVDLDLINSKEHKISDTSNHTCPLASKFKTNIKTNKQTKQANNPESHYFAWASVELLDSVP